jgi:hypothetical protein
VSPHDPLPWPPPGLTGPGAEMVEAAPNTPTMAFHVEREHITEGKSFSREALDALGTLMVAWVEARAMERWHRTGEPPSVIDVDVTVHAQ